MNRFSTLSVTIGIAAAAVLVQPLAAQAGGIARPMIHAPGMGMPGIGTVHTPINDPLPPGLMRDPIVRDPIVTRNNAGPVAPIKIAPSPSTGSNVTPVTPIKLAPSPSTGSHVTPVTPIKLAPLPGTGVHATPITPIERAPEAAPTSDKP
jgi:hypothetical protein